MLETLQFVQGIVLNVQSETLTALKTESMPTIELDGNLVSDATASNLNLIRVANAAVVSLILAVFTVLVSWDERNLAL